MKLLITLAAICLVAGSATAGDLIVVNPGGSIQAAVDAADPGDTIEVKKGLYIETVFVYKDRLTLKGKGAIIDAEYEAPCITVDADDITITGFTLVNGTAGVRAAGFGPGPDPKDGEKYEADDIYIYKNTAIACMPLGGFLVWGNDARFESNTVRGAGGYGIWYHADSPESRTWIVKNTVSKTQYRYWPWKSNTVSGDGIYAEGGRLDILQNRSEDNAFAGIEVVMWGDASEGKPENQYYVRLIGNIAFRNGGEIEIEEPQDGTPWIYSEDGIFVLNPEGMRTLLEKNVSHYNGDDGIKVVGERFDILGNKASYNNDDGIDMDAAQSRVDKNTTTHNLDDGVFGHPFGGFGDVPDGGNIITNNTSGYNADEGFNIYGSYHVISKNKANSNLQNGIRVAEGSFVVISYNAADKNGHQGITNSCDMTDILFNKAKGNACGFGPDIAGQGDGSGYVDNWAGNQYGTGGQYAQDRCVEPD